MELTEALDAFGSPHKPAERVQSVAPPAREDIGPRPANEPPLVISRAELQELSRIPRDFMVTALRLAAEVKKINDQNIASDPLTLARFGLVCKLTRQFIRDNQTQLGFYPDEARTIEQKAWDLSSQIADHPYGGRLTPNLRRGIDVVARRLIGAHAGSVLVGLGNSPTPIMAYLSLKYPDAFALVNVPLGNVAKGPAVEIPDAEKQSENVFTYLDAFEHVRWKDVGARKVVLLDYTVDARAIRLAHNMLVRYYQDRLKLGLSDAKAKVHAVAIKSGLSTMFYENNDPTETWDRRSQLIVLDAKAMGGEVAELATAMDKKWLKEHFLLIMYTSVDREKVKKGEGLAALRLLAANYQRLLAQLPENWLNSFCVSGDSGKCANHKGIKRGQQSRTPAILFGDQRHRAMRIFVTGTGPDSSKAQRVTE